MIIWGAVWYHTLVGENKEIFFLHSNHYMQNYDVKTSFEARVEYYRYISPSLMTVVEFHSVAGEIQYIFTSKWTLSKDILIGW